jgi:hypothetical protein
MAKAEVLGQRLIEDAERMREVHAAIDRERCAVSLAPGGAGEVTEAIDRDGDRALERRREKGRGEVREVVLDVLHLPGEGLAGECLVELLRDRTTAARVAHAVEHQLGIGALTQRVGDLAREASPGVGVERDAVDVP